jgi:hypothetical protein
MGVAYSSIRPSSKQPSFRLGNKKGRQVNHSILTKWLVADLIFIDLQKEFAYR